MQDYLGHRDPRHTVHYARVSSRRLKGCGSDDRSSAPGHPDEVRGRATGEQAARTGRGAKLRWTGARGE